MSWWGRVWRRARLEADLEKEIRFHLDQHAADLTADGLDAHEARRRAALVLGGPEQVKEACRDARGTRWLDDLMQDLRFTLRSLWLRPGFAAIAVATLALGIGATTVMFTVVDGVLLRPLPYADPDRLVTLEEQTDWSNAFGNRWAFAYPNFLDCRREARTLLLAAWRYSGGILDVGGDPEYVDGVQVSSELFAVLGVRPAKGRAFRADEDRPGASPVAIISDALSRRRFAGAGETVGTTIVFEGQPYTIVGITPHGVPLPGDADVFTLLGQSSDPALTNRERHPGLQVWARLAPGASLAEAQAELAAVGRSLATAYPKSNAGRSFVADRLRPDVGDTAPMLWLLLGAVAVLLAIACANVASLLLARAVARERELAMRAALGAGRLRLIRQCLTESIVLGLLGGTAGIALATGGLRPFVALWPGSLPRAEQVHLDWRVLLFALAVSLASGLVFGLAPALRAPARGLDRTLREGGRTIGAASHRLHAAFAVAQIALAAVLLTCATVLGRTVLALASLDPGMRLQNVLVARTALSPAVLDHPDRTRHAWDEVLARTRTLPGVASAAIVDTVPMREGNNQTGYWTSAALPAPAEMPTALATCVTPGYLDAMGLSLRAGRFFDDHDRMGSQPVVVVDDVLARSAFAGQDAVGRSIWIPGLGEGPFEIVGVVGHVRHWGFASDDRARVRAQYYYPFAQLPDRFVRRWSELMSIAVRTTVPPSALADPLRHAVRGASGDQVIYEVRTMEQLASGTLARHRFLLLLFSVFGVLALVLASIGIYGVLAYMTGQRVPEIGIRMALGATAGGVVRLVVADSAGIIFGGIVVGVPCALAAVRGLAHLVDGVRGTDIGTFAAAQFVLVASALAATWVPARRASRVDPATALK